MSLVQVMPVASGGPLGVRGHELLLAPGSCLGLGTGVGPATRTSGGPEQGPSLRGASCSLPLPLLGRFLSEKTVGGGVEVCD